MDQLRTSPRSWLKATLVFLLVNLGAIYLYLVLLGLAGGAGKRALLNAGGLSMLLVAVPVVAVESIFFLRARSWPKALLVLYLGMLVDLAVVGVVATGSVGVLVGPTLFQLVALPGLVLVVAANWIAYAKVGVPGAEQLRRPR